MLGYYRCSICSTGCWMFLLETLLGMRRLCTSTTFTPENAMPRSAEACLIKLRSLDFVLPIDENAQSLRVITCPMFDCFGDAASFYEP